MAKSTKKLKYLPMMLDTEEVIEEESPIMPSLPEEIIADILSFLPVKSIFRFRCVCKNWCNNLFKDPKFAKLHLNNAMGNNKYFSLLTRRDLPMYSVNLGSSTPQSDESVAEIDSPFLLESYYYGTYGSCNGLICLHNPRNYEDVIVWNPSTNEVKEIPKPTTPVRGRIIRYGFGYSPISDDYKIVRAEMFIDANGTYRSDSKVFTLGSNSWTTILNNVPYEIYSGGGRVKPVSINGVLYWIGSSPVGIHHFFHRVVIFSFDIENNTFNEVPVNKELQESPGYDVRCFNDCSSDLVSDRSADSGEYAFLGSFCGCLSVVLQCGEFDSAANNNSNISIWVMKEHGVKESWSKMFTVTKQSLERSIQYSKMKVLNATNDVVLFLKDQTSLVLYDPKLETARVVNICGFSEDWSYVQTYVDSLISLNSGTYLHLNWPQRE